jgi:hypothetical protein
LSTASACFYRDESSRGPTSAVDLSRFNELNYSLIDHVVTRRRRQLLGQPDRVLPLAVEAVQVLRRLEQHKLLDPALGPDPVHPHKRGLAARRRGHALEQPPETLESFSNVDRCYSNLLDLLRVKTRVSSYNLYATPFLSFPSRT